MQKHETPSTTDHRKRPRKRQPPRTLPSLMDEHVLSMREVLERIPIERHTLQKLVREGRFPPPIRITSAKVGWRWSRILTWLADCERHPVDRRAYFGNDK